MCTNILHKNSREKFSAINRNVFVKAVNVLTGLLLVTWLKGAISETLTAAFVLLVASREVTAGNLKLIEDLVGGLKSNEKLAKMVLISERWVDTSKLKHKLNLESKKTISNLGYLVVRVGNRNAGLLRGVEWCSLVMAIDSTKLE